jgi:hypothetical protein
MWDAIVGAAPARRVLVRADPGPPPQCVSARRSSVAPPCSLIGAPCSLVGAARSLIGTPCSLVGTPCSLVGSPRSLVGSPRSLVGAPSSPDGAPRSLLSAPCSAIGRLRPLVGLSCSLVGRSPSLIGRPDGHVSVRISIDRASRPPICIDVPVVDPTTLRFRVGEHLLPYDQVQRANPFKVPACRGERIGQTSWVCSRHLWM